MCDQIAFKVSYRYKYTACLRFKSVTEAERMYNKNYCAVDSKFSFQDGGKTRLHNGCTVIVGIIMQAVITPVFVTLLCMSRSSRLIAWLLSCLGFLLSARRTT